MTALEQLGVFVAHADAPSAGLRETLELHVVDTIGAWLASARTAEGAALLRWRKALRDVAPSPFGPAHPPRLDVATHCALARMSEIDDIHLASTTTPGAIVISGAIAAAAGLPSRDSAAAAAPGALAAAMIAGYEVMVRLGQAIDGAAILYRGIWPTYFTAPVGMAAVAARLLGLDARRVAHALALALTRAAPGVGHHGRRRPRAGSRSGKPPRRASLRRLRRAPASRAISPCWTVISSHESTTSSPTPPRSRAGSATASHSPKCRSNRGAPRARPWPRRRP